MALYDGDQLLLVYTSWQHQSHKVGEFQFFINNYFLILIIFQIKDKILTIPLLPKFLEKDVDYLLFSLYNQVMHWYELVLMGKSLKVFLKHYKRVLITHKKF